jgi:hypothetical protein
MWPPLPGYAADPDAIESFAKAMSNCAGQVNILGFSRPFEETLCTAASEFLLAVQE